MRMDDFDQAENGKRVWLDREELDLLVGEVVGGDPRREIAFNLGGRSGLRRGEIVSVTPNDFGHAPEGFLRVWGDYTKRNKYRETPVPEGMAHMIRGMQVEPDEPVVSVHDDTVYRWVTDAAEALYGHTGDEGWRFVTPHDLRRTWAAYLLFDCGVLPAVVMNWGGWEDWKTFRDHYLSEMSPAAAERERSKIFDENVREDPVFEPAIASNPGYSSA